MTIIGQGVREMHCFQEKTQKTSKVDLNKAEKRYRDLTKELNQ